MVLIPKSPGADSLDNFRPISLCNSLYKIISKVLTLRMLKILPMIISQHQSGFVPGRQILDSVQMVHEVIHSLEASKWEGMFLKLDLSKAYDRVDWSLLGKVLSTFGFDSKVCKIISQLVSTSSLAVLVNGVPSNFFKPSRGLRQGDPLSPILFIILAECLGRIIDCRKREACIKGILPSSNCIPFTHQQFVDDTILGGEASVKEARALKKILDTYSSGTGQLINWNKSSLFFINTSEFRQRKIARILGYGVGSFPSTYLGLPLGSSPPESFWNGILDRFNRKMAGWKGVSLSQAGKCLLVKSSLQNLPIYALSLFGILGKIAERMEKIQRDFLWNGNEGKKRYPLVAWEKVCLPKRYGGLGIRKITHLNKALRAKQIWRIFSSTGEWRDTLVNKYLRRPTLLFTLFNEDIPKGSNIWNGIMKARDLAKARISWKLGNRKDIQFWSDRWLSQDPLINNPIFERWMQACTDQIGSKVCDYWNGQEWSDLSLISEDLTPIMLMLNSMIPINLGDELVWRDNPNGRYSVASGYNSLWSLKEKAPWAEAWIPGLTPKINIFYWLALQNKILTHDNLMKRGHVMPSRCPLCKNQAETGNHIFILCDYAREVWNVITHDNETLWCKPDNLMDFFHQWKGLCKIAGRQDHSDWILPHFCWGIWKERNNRIFRDREEPAIILGKKVSKNIKENLQVLKEEEEEEGDRKIAKEKDRNLKRQDASWLLPPDGWSKANFDGASKGNPGPSGCGGIIRNSYGEGIAAFASPLGIQTIHLAEARAASKVVKLAFEAKITKLWLVGDSKNIINTINGISPPSWMIVNIIAETCATLTKFDKVHVNHVYREANPVADWFANKGVNATNNLTWHAGKDFPAEAKLLIDQDKILGRTAQIQCNYG